jgi:nitrogen fixation protein NifQ
MTGLGIAPLSVTGLMEQALAGVLRHAQEGELPLSLWTLNLPQDAFIAMIRDCFPGSGYLQPLPTQQYENIRQTLPRAYIPLCDFLLCNTAPHLSPHHADRAARVVAAACLGERHLWQDLGLPGREAVSTLLAHYFPALHQRNVQNIRWKRFIFEELSTTTGQPLITDSCRNCTDFALCFPDQ